MSIRVSSTLRWVLSPTVPDVPRSHAVASAFLRVLVGLLWLYNVSWKRPPDFGQDRDNGLWHFTLAAVENPVFPPYSWVVEHLVLPVFPLFGWGVLVAETALAVMLLTGSFVRLAALLGVAQSLAIGLSVAQTPGEWPWSYWMMIGIHVVLLFSAAGSVLAVDAWRARPRRDPRHRRLLPLVWGTVTVVAGVVALALSLGDPLAGRGAALGGPGLSISLGSYNLLGALVLVLVGALLVVMAVTANRGPGKVAAAVAAVAAVSIYLQLPFTSSWLGGTNTSAAFLVCAGVIGWVGATAARETADRAGPPGTGPETATVDGTGAEPRPVHG
ncbi:MAG: hypothetical protein WB798_01705 [Nocardioidaceae bacterium]